MQPVPKSTHSTYLLLSCFLQSTSTDAVVEGRDFLVTYQIINVGNAAATSIEVSDRYDAAR